MRTWHTCRYAQRCQECNSAIVVGATLLVIHLATRETVRCARCAERLFGEPAPAVIEDADAEAASVPDGIRHQPSLGFEPIGDVGRRHVSNHLRQRGRR